MFWEVLAAGFVAATIFTIIIWLLSKPIQDNLTDD